jgi:hypothetical protein
LAIKLPWSFNEADFEGLDDDERWAQISRRLQDNFDTLETTFPLGTENLGNIPAVHVYNDTSANNPIPSGGGTYTALVFNQERYDTHAMHSTSSNTSRLTCVVPGVYRIWGRVYWPGSSTGYRELEILRNGTDQIALITESNPGTVALAQEITVEWELAKDSYVELRAFQSSGGTLNATAVNYYSPTFGMSWIRPKTT